MGQACGITRYNKVYEFEPTLLEWRSDFEALQFKENDIGRLYRIYNKIDEDRSGLIDYMEMLNYLDIERTPFSKRVFTMFDEDGSGKLDFKEFVMSLWNYCTLSKSTLVLFAFDIYDKDSSGEIEGKEVQQMLQEIYGKSYKNNIQALAISKLIETDLGDVDLEEFKEFSRNHPAMLFPAFYMQQLIQKGVLGEQFWKYYSSKRIELSKGEWVPIVDFMQIHIDKDLKAQITSNVQGKKLNKKTLEIIEKTGSAADRRMSKVAVTDHDHHHGKKSIAAVATKVAVIHNMHPEELFFNESKSDERRKSVDGNAAVRMNKSVRVDQRTITKTDANSYERRKSFDKEDGRTGSRRNSFDKEDANGNPSNRKGSVVKADHSNTRRKSFD